MSRIGALISSRPSRFLVFLSELTWLVGVLVLWLRPPALANGETVSWWTTALNLAHGQGYSLCVRYYFPFCGPANQVSAAREPAPVLLFAGVGGLFNDSLLAAGVVEVLLHVGVVVTLYFLIRELAGPVAGLIGGLIWAVYPPALALISQVSGDLLAALGVTVGVLFVIRGRGSGRVRDWLVGGLGLGIAALSRSATLAVTAGILAGLAVEGWVQRARIPGGLYRVAWVALTVAAALTPWLVRNKLVLGRPVLGSTLVGYNVYRQNYALGKGNYFHYVGTIEGWHAIRQLVASQTGLTGSENEAQMNQVYLQAGLQVIAQHPAEYLRLSLFRFLPLWFDWGVSREFGYAPGVYEYALMVIQAVLLILALIGLPRNFSRTWPLWAGTIALSAAYMAVDSRMLYVVCVMPLVICLAVIGARDLGELIRRGGTIGAARAPADRMPE